VPLIYQGAVRSYKYKAYGLPDLIVRDDYVARLIADSSAGQKVIPELTVKTAPGAPHFYLALDIKSCTLGLRADGFHLLNQFSIPAYKVQILVYTEALAEMQGVNPKQAFIMGTAWTNKSVVTPGSGPGTERLGVINYETIDKEFYAKMTDALKWYRRMKLEGHRWTVLPKPSVPELYPNMSNKEDGAWHEYKGQLAKELAEISNIWQCGLTQREKAHKEEVYRWDDENCTADLLGFNPESKNAKIIDKILCINRQKTDLIWPSRIEENYRNWQLCPVDFPEQQPVSIYLDLETVAPLVFPGLPPGRKQFTSILGCIAPSSVSLAKKGQDEAQDQTYTFTSLRANTLTSDEEKRIWNEFYQIVKRCTNSGRRTVNIYVWGNFESTVFSELACTYPQEDFVVSPLIRDNLVNFIEIMHAEPIVVKGALDFSLKEIAGAMRENNLIKTDYRGSSVHEGTGAMIALAELYKANAPALAFVPIEAYNRLDCEAMKEIIECLRAHGKSKADESPESSESIEWVRVATPECTPVHTPEQPNRQLNEALDDLPVEQGVCCWCKGPCNPCSQACGRCLRNGPPELRPSAYIKPTTPPRLLVELSDEESMSSDYSADSEEYLAQNRKRKRAVEPVAARTRSKRPAW